MTKILIIDDEREMAETCARLLRPLQVECTVITDGLAALQLLQQDNFHLVLTDLRMPGCSGMDIVKAVRERKIPVIMLTGFGSIDVAVEAIKQGAFDFLAKPFSGDQLRVCVERALREVNLQQENESLRNQLRAAFPTSNIIGHSPSIQAVIALARKVANTDAGVLILGESGTGKEVFARTIHAHSSRMSKPFVPIDCAALPEHLLESELFGYEKGAFTGANQTKQGLLETAHGGTLFLDELGELGLGLQAKLLRVLQERAFRRVGGKNLINVDVRVIAATNVDLLQAVEQKQFREDLYYRLNVVTLRLPPLRERQEDIPVLAQEFLHQANTRFTKHLQGIAPQTVRLLEAYPWPGNIRQLKNAIEHAVVFSEDTQLQPQDLPAEISEAVSAPAKDSLPGQTVTPPALRPEFQLDGTYHEVKERWLEYFQSLYLKRLLARAEGNISQAARLAQIDRRTIHRWLNEADNSDHKPKV